MRTIKVATAILLVGVLGLAWRLEPVTAAATQQELLLTELQQQTQTPYNLQSQCAEMARKFLSSRDWKIGANDNYKNHFNSKLKVCFILVSSYLPNDDFVSMDLYDAVEGNRYATFVGHQNCDLLLNDNPKKCAMDSGHIWFDGNDSRTPADVIVGFRGLLYGGGSGDSNTLKTFLERIKPFMTQ